MSIRNTGIYEKSKKLAKYVGVPRRFGRDCSNIIIKSRYCWVLPGITRNKQKIPRNEHELLRNGEMNLATDNRHQNATKKLSMVMRSQNGRTSQAE